MALNNLPKVGQSVVGKDGIATQPWYAWFGRIQSALNVGTLATDAVSAAITTIANILGSPDGTVANIPPLAFLRSTTFVHAGTGIGVSGTLAAGGVDVSLDAVLADLNDVGAAAPSAGDALVWDGSEWAPGAVSGGFVPTLIASGATFTVPADTQALFAFPIEVEGFLAVDGMLIEVA